MKSYSAQPTRLFTNHLILQTVTVARRSPHHTIGLRVNTWFTSYLWIPMRWTCITRSRTISQDWNLIDIIQIRAKVISSIVLAMNRIEVFTVWLYRWQSCSCYFVFAIMTKVSILATALIKWSDSKDNFANTTILTLILIGIWYTRIVYCFTSFSLLKC